jgi:hypothetical protein
LLVPDASSGRDWIKAAPEQLQRLWTAATKPKVIYKPPAKVLRSAWTGVVE